MTKFHVDLGETRTEEPQPERQFKKFKKLRDAVRWAKYEWEEGRFRNLPDILDENGDKVNIDWDGPEWLTRDELYKKLAQAEQNREMFRKENAKLQEAQARKDNELIRAGYIPVSLLRAHAVDIMVRRDGGNGISSMFPRDFPAPTETTYHLQLRQFATSVGAEQHPFITAMQAITQRIIEGNINQ